MKRTLQLEVDCEDNTCGNCHMLLGDCCGTICSLFLPTMTIGDNIAYAPGTPIVDKKRCFACIRAEVK
jgi:hypothetical protein